MELHQWDIVSALSLPAVNMQLRRNFGQLPSSFEFIDEEPTGGSMHLKGTFSDWQLVPGGAGNLVHLVLSIGQGTCVRSQGAVSATDDLAGIQVKVELMLSFVQAMAAVPERELRFDFKTDHGQVPSDPAIFCKEVTLPPGSTLGMVSKMLIGQALIHCLFAHQANVAYVFATLRASTSGSLPAPRHYAFLNIVPAGTGQTYFAILSAVFPEHEPGQAVVDAALFDPSAPVVLALSKEYLLHYIVQPQLPAAFRNGTPARDFAYHKGIITNNSSFSLRKVKKGLLWYEPVVEKLRISVEGPYLEVNVQGSTYISPGIMLRFTCISRNSVTVEPHGIRFCADPQPVMDHHTDMAWWVIALGFVGGFISAIVDAIVLGIIAAVSGEVAHGLNDQEHAFSMQQLTPAFLDWQGFRLDTITSGGLQNNLFLRGS